MTEDGYLAADEFQHFCRETFGFLVDEYGFSEASQTHTPYEIRFLKNRGQIIVGTEGYHSEATLHLRAPSGDFASFGHLIPNDHWKHHRQGFGYGLAGGLRYDAFCLRQFGGAFLKGDWSGMDSLMQAAREWSAKNKASWEQHDREWRANRAVDAAAPMFLKGDYAAVVRLLAPHEGHLPRAQQMKLRIARERSQA